jgi:purine-nucleoside phosphorylase
MNDAIERSAARLRESGIAPRVAVLLGTGWGPVADLVRGAVDIGYEALPAFPALRVGGHAGHVRLGRIGGRDVAVLAGRQHAYEAGEADGMKGAIRTLAALGVRVLVQTNAAGSLDPRMAPGSLMRITDHLNLVQRSPLFHEPGDDRFVDMSAAYDPALGAQARAVAARLGILLHEGIYAWVMGPQFETPAEIRWLRQLGAQAVGMSTVPETILARHAKMKVLALSMFTNLAAGLSAEVLTHAHTMAIAKTGTADAVRLIEALVPALEIS